MRRQWIPYIVFALHVNCGVSHHIVQSIKSDNDSDYTMQTGSLLLASLEDTCDDRRLFFSMDEVWSLNIESKGNSRSAGLSGLSDEILHNIQDLSMCRKKKKKNCRCLLAISRWPRSRVSFFVAISMWKDINGAIVLRLQCGTTLLVYKNSFSEF